MRTETSEVNLMVNGGHMGKRAVDRCLSPSRIMKSNPDNKTEKEP